METAKPVIVKESPKDKYLIIFDAGHGINTKGKRTPFFEDGSFMKEWEFNIDVARRCVKLCQDAGFETVLLNPEEMDLPLSSRSKRENRLFLEAKEKGKTPIFISIHANGHGNDNQWNSAKGVVTLHQPITPRSEFIRTLSKEIKGKIKELDKEDKFYAEKYDDIIRPEIHRRVQGKVLAGEIQKVLVRETKLHDRAFTMARDTSVPQNLHITRETKSIAALVECGFMTNKVEAALQRTDDFRRICAESTVEGTFNYIKILEI
ncbi:N-acetylmuramoyl-L-alanine amidase [Bernardetia sp. OM2101]|uniref:N-acetylmuramoyl-L-alanine amidase family protein n=1 Tax=Bernardetia sp. OM2101 TaxID=3344876 RepID=UPI0035CF27AD